MLKNNFQLLSSNHIDSLHLTLHIYKHSITEARHIHLESASDENMFLVALRTLPEDSTGVAHILEHTALCGSRSFPVRDPFFSMLKRSLQTFMNAFTSSDWTAYPFATQNKKDYFGLLDVYLDAVFFPKLDPLSFAQEGHRFEYDEDTLSIKGVVYNEMKGVYGNVIERIYEDIKSSLHPVTTYHHDSGGNPRDIPDLTYEDFKHFHEVHYHPTNATFITFGNIPTSEIQSRIESRVLQEFEYGHKVTPRDEKRLASQEINYRSYPGSEDAECYVHISTLLNRVTHIDDLLDLQVFHALLTAHAGSPLTKWIEESEDIQSPSPLMGIDDSGREVRYTIGWITSRNTLEKTRTDFAAWQKSLDNWIPDSQEYNAIIDRLELQLQDRPNNSSYPLGLEYALTIMGAVMHDGNPGDHLDLTDALARLRMRTMQAGYFCNLLHKIWIEQPHQVTNLHTPDTQMNQQETKREQDYIKLYEASLTESDKQNIIHQSAQLKSLQESHESLDCLPIIAREDIPRNTLVPRLNLQKTSSGIRIATITQGVNRTQIFGSYDGEDLFDMSLTLKLLGQISTSHRDYIALGKDIQAMTGGISQQISLKSHEQGYRTLITTTARHLDRYTQSVIPLLYEITQESQCDRGRLETLLGEMSSGLDAEIIGSGQKFAMMEATALLSEYGSLVASLSGVDALKRIQTLSNKDHLDDAVIMVNKQLEYLSKTSFETIQISDHQSNESNVTLSAVNLNSLTPGSQPISYRKKAYLFESLVSYHSRAYFSNRSRSLWDDAVHLILAQYLRDAALHTLIREQGGAYGGGASYDRETGVFRTFSYRDPRLLETYDDFDRGLAMIADGSRLSDNLLFGALLGCISQIDKPLTPLSETLHSLRLTLLGEPLDEKIIIRSHLLDVTLNDIQQAARAILDGARADVSISGTIHRDIFEQNGYIMKFWS